MRAVLLASATATTLAGLRARSARTHSASFVARLRACRRTATAPATSRQRMYLSPRLLVRPSRSLPPEEFWRGVMPSQAANSRPEWNRFGSETVAAIALAPMMPTWNSCQQFADPIAPMPFGQFRLDLPDFGLRIVQLRHDEPKNRPRKLRQRGIVLFDSTGQPF